MLHDVDTTLRNLLVGELKEIPGCPIVTPEQIQFMPPSVTGTLAQGAGSARSEQGTEREEKREGKGEEREEVALNLYLHNVRENLALRDETFQRQGKAGARGVSIQRAPARFDLSYLVTVTGLTGMAEHRLLADVLTVLMRSELVDSKYLTGSLAQLGKNALMLAVAQPDHPAHSDPSGLWRAMAAPLRPSLGLVATAMFNPYVTRWTPLVLEAVAGLGQGATPDTLQRPLDNAIVRVSIAGVVLDQQEEKPVEGVRLELEGGEKTAYTNREGFFYLLDLPPGPHTLAVSHRRYVPRTAEAIAPPIGQPNLLTPLTIALTRREDAALALATAEAEETQRNLAPIMELGRTTQVTLAGCLRLANGKPAAYIPVRCGEHQTTTNADGVYCFFDLPSDLPSTDVTLYAEMPGHGAVEVPAPPAGNRDSRLHPTLTLPDISHLRAVAPSPSLEVAGHEGAEGEQKSERTATQSTEQNKEQKEQQSEQTTTQAGKKRAR